MYIYTNQNILKTGIGNHFLIFPEISSNHSHLKTPKKINGLKKNESNPERLKHIYMGTIDFGSG